MDRYTRYYVNQSGSCEIGTVYRASFRVQRGNGIGSFLEDFRLLNLWIFRGKGCRKRGFENRFNIIKDILHKQPEQPVGNIFKNRFIEAKFNLEENIKNFTGCGLGLKR